MSDFTNDEMKQMFESGVDAGAEWGVKHERIRIIAIIKQAQEDARSGKGGYKREAAEAFGQSWPLVKGWKSKLIELIEGKPKTGPVFRDLEVER